jgi:hypothetical protein
VTAPRFEIIGVIKVRGCCLFTWRDPDSDSGPRQIEVTDEHCERCIAEVQQIPGRPVLLVDRRRG